MPGNTHLSARSNLSCLAKFDGVRADTLHIPTRDAFLWYDWVKGAVILARDLILAWVVHRSTLCPNTKSLQMHQGVCEGQLISQTRDMCKKTELLPGVLVNHFPLGSQGLDKIDDNWLGLSQPVEEDVAAPVVEEGGDEGGEIASGYMASG
jgi:hypothetical protein